VFYTYTCKISAIKCKGNIFKFRVEWREKKTMCFQRKTGPISETVRDRAKITILESGIHLFTYIKIIDLR